jgi:AcrR family transcriptional regulator
MNQTKENQHSISNSESGGAETDPALCEPTIAPGVRERIVREATRLFSAKGYNGVSVREIVKAAGITKPTLYYYYQSKEQLFERIILDTLEDFRRQLERVVKQSGPIRDRLLSICRLHLEFPRSNTERSRLAHSVYFSSERSVIPFDFDAYYRSNFALVRDVLAEGITSGELRAGDPWLMALAFIGSIHMFIMAILHDPAGLPTEGLAEAVTDMALKGLEATGEKPRQGGER